MLIAHAVLLKKKKKNPTAHRLKGSFKWLTARANTLRAWQTEDWDF